MIEEKVIAYLANDLRLPVYAEVPEANSGSFVVVEKTGSGRVNRLDSATLAVQSYADTLAAAAALNETVKASMFDMIAEDSVSSVRLNSDYNFTDTSTKRYRYQAVFVVTYY